MKKQRLIVLFDGTWNDPEDKTNVYRVSRSINDYDGDVRQRFFYDPGVGTSRFNRFRGGVFGWGLSKNLLQGYEWLVKRYSPGDEIWVFGFSRGAYTARSLVGMIRKCGLLHITTPRLLADAEALYRNKEAQPNGEQCENFRRNYSRKVTIHFIGVWDTVGALGIPGTFLSEKGRYSWHDTELSHIVERAYQAAALDEHRSAYDIALWTHDSGAPKPQQIKVEQRWFIGAHSNVGGGYGDDPLADLALVWIQEKALEAGLKLAVFPVQETAWQSQPRDSFKEFLKGGYAWYRKVFHSGDGRHYRRFAEGHQGKPAVNVTVDPSVWQHWASDSQYRPPTLTQAGISPPVE